jgi:hypothetical protein
MLLLLLPQIVPFIGSSRVVYVQPDAAYRKLSWPRKDPDEILDHLVDWTQRLYSADELALLDAGETVVPADTIDISQFTLPPGIIAESSSNIASASKVWLSEGVEGETYLVQNRIVTAGGRTMDQTIKLKIKTK